MSLIITPDTPLVKRIAPPVGMYEPPGGLVWRGTGYAVGASPTRFLHDASSNYYVDSSRPDNSGNGLTPATAKRDWWAVLNILPFPDVGPVTVWIKSGRYDLTKGWSAGNINGITVLSRANMIATANLNTAALTGWEPGVARTTTAYESLVWALDSGSTYKAALATTPYVVIDEANANPYGAGSRLTLQSSIVTVNANPGSWWWDAGSSQLYVRTLDGRAPDSNVMALKDTYNGKMNLAAVSMYADGIEWVGGTHCLNITTGSTVTFNRCKFQYGKQAGLSSNACSDVRVFNSRADANGADGLDYTTVLRALEVNAYSTYNGWDGSNINNASSMHSGGQIYRVNGTYLDSQGINVADVGGGKSALLGCTLHTTRSSDSTRQVNFWTGDGGVAYLERCRLSDNTTDLRADGATDVINVWSSTYDPAKVTGAGTVRRSRGVR